MKRHKWIENKCVCCGISRERKTRSLLMAIVNHPPWEVWKHEFIYQYTTQDGNKNWKRPDCKKAETEKQKIEESPC